MRKSEIEAIPLCRCYRKKGWYTNCKAAKLSTENATIIDVFYDNDPVIRFVIGANQYLSYDYRHQKWGQRKITKDWGAPCFGEIIGKNGWGEKTLIIKPEAVNKSVLKTFGNSWLRRIKENQTRIDRERKERNRQLSEWHSRETAAMIPSISDQFEKFVKADWNESIVWTHEQDNRTFLTCSHCGKRDVVSGSLKKSKKIRCAYCDKVGRRKRERDYEQIIEEQRFYNDVRPYEKGVAIVAVRVTKRQQVAMPVWYEFEEEACMIFLPKRKTPDEYWIVGGRWKKGVHKNYSYSGYKQNKTFPTGPVPGYAVKVLKDSKLKYTGWEYYGAEMYKYLRHWQQVPQLELLAKAGLKKLITYKLNETPYSTLNIDLAASSFADIFGILPERRKMLIDSEGDPEMLKTLQMERSIGRMQDRTIELIRDMSSYDRKNIQDISQWVSPDKAVKYLASQTQTEDNPITLYADYLKMRNDMHYPMNERLFPRDLVAAHDALIDEKDRENRDKRANEYERKYPKVSSAYRRLNKIYKFEDGDYIIRPAKSCKEIVEEGATLHHCVGASDTYISKHNKGTSYILLMRKKAEKNKPFCTIEIKADNTIAQWYEAYDKKPDEAILQPILNRYVEHLKEREAI